MRANVLLTLGFVVVVATVLTGCGNGRTGGPKGTPEAVVAAAPADTVAAGRTVVQAATSDTISNGWVDFARNVPHVTVSGRGAGHAPALLRDPQLAVQVVKGAIDVIEYGGVEVRGASTIRYEFDVDPQKADLGPVVADLHRPTFYADAWVDGQGRLRQVMVPLDINANRPGTNATTEPLVITVQFFDYGQESP